ncbi:MAG: hypothetical protein WCC99_04315 [Candidatus Sulfotelmatobacter sp.]
MKNSQVDEMDRKRRYAKLDPRQSHFDFYLDLTRPLQPDDEDDKADEMCEKAG